MPIYEYVCGSCRKKTEVIQRMNEPKLKVCPHCGGKLTKAFSAPAIQFRGSGFYITDYARARSEEGGKKAAEGEKSEAAGKAEKVEKAEKAEKPEKPEKAEKKKEKKT